MNNNYPLVSAVIPVYNGEKFLAETIESVLEQTYPNIECIVINDGSTDKTAEIAKSFGDKIRYFEKPNGGVSSTRNLGIKKSNGEYIAFLDADDLWMPRKIEKQIGVLQNNSEIGLIYSKVNIVNEKKELIEELKGNSGKSEIERILLLEQPVYLTMTGVAPKKVFESVGHFDENLSTSADADMACRIALKYPLIEIDESLALYRQHSNQMHLNLEVLNHDATILFDKVFNSSNITNNISKLKSKAYSSLETTLAIGYLSKKDYKHFFRHLIKGLKLNPLIVFGKLMQICRKRLKL